jgi:hypothetical protein
LDLEFGYVLHFFIAFGFFLCPDCKVLNILSIDISQFSGVIGHRAASDREVELDH